MIIFQAAMLPPYQIRVCVVETMESNKRICKRLRSSGNLFVGLVDVLKWLARIDLLFGISI